jgi:hypothetical protein
MQITVYSDPHNLAAARGDAYYRLPANGQHSAQSRAESIAQSLARANRLRLYAVRNVNSERLGSRPIWTATFTGRGDSQQVQFTIT